MDKKGNRPQPTGEYRRGSLHGTVSRGIRRSRGLGPGGQGPEAKAAAAVADRAPRLRFRVSVTVRNCDRGTGDPDERPPHTGSAGMRPRLSPHPRATPDGGIKHTTPKPHDPAKKKKKATNEILYTTDNCSGLGRRDSTQLRLLSDGRAHGPWEESAGWGGGACCQALTVPREW